MNVILPASASKASADDSALRQLLEAWVRLGEVERRGFLAMAEEVGACATLVEDATVDLSARFRELATAAEAQTDRVERIADTARSIEVEGTAMSLPEATRLVEAVVAEAIGGLHGASQQAASMARALEEVSRDVEGMERCVAQIDTINRQAKFVALNALIEAQRADSGTSTFKVIANELKELSNDTDRTSHMVRERIGKAGQGVRGARAELARIAAADGSSMAASQARLGAVIRGMVAQNAALGATLEEARQAARDIDAVVGQLITGTQFQDRASQHLTHVVEALGALREATEALQADSLTADPALKPELHEQDALMRRLLDRQSLSAVRQRFFARLLHDTDAAPPESPAGGDIELF